MVTATDVLNIVLIATAVRQLWVLRGIATSRRFLRAATPAPNALPGSDVQFYVVIPVLREAAQIEKTVQHFDMLIRHHAAELVLVTTERERVERSSHRGKDTIGIASALAQSGRIMHLHFPDPKGVKGDQLNFAVAHCLSQKQEHRPASRVFFVVYDADSRPPLDSLTCFAQAISENPDTSVFHQSSLFELRLPAANTVLGGLRRCLADSGALRANRYVLAYELSRLITRSDGSDDWIGFLRSFIYRHVTGHGLCLRGSLLQKLPFPSRSPLEDMHYSFVLCSRRIRMVPVRSLDHAEVPGSLRVQFQQLARWFCGPGQFRRYFTDPNTQPGLRAYLLAITAALYAAGWIGCAVALPSLLVAALIGDGTTLVLIGILIAVYVMQLLIVERALAMPGRSRAAFARILAFPFTLTMFGLAGIVGAVRLLRGSTRPGKTERPECTYNEACGPGGGDDRQF